MLSRPLAALLDRRGVHYGWIVAAITAVTMLVTAGTLGSSGVFIEPLGLEFGWPTAEVSAALALRLLLYGLIAPFAAALMNRFGVRRVVLFALPFVATGLAASTRMQSLWQLVLLWGFVVGAGTGMTAGVLAATVANRWFVRRRGFVLGLLTASTATGQMIFLPLLAGINAHQGWRASIGVICASLAFVAVGVWLVLRDRPEELGLGAFGEEPRAGAPAGTAASANPFTALREAARARVFWVLFGSFFVCGATTNGLIQTHFISLCGEFGMRPPAAAGVLALMGAVAFLGTVASGWLSDRFDNRWLLGWYYGLRGLSLLCLPLARFTFAGLAPFAVSYGLDWVATVPPTVRLTTERFGRAQGNVVFGWIFAGHQLGAASAALAGGLARTTLSTYVPAFYGAGVLCLAAALVLFTLPRRIAVRRTVAGA